MAPDAVPVAANHAALSNRISMLLASQSSILKTLNPSSAKKPSSSKSTTVNHAKTQAEIDDEELFKNNARPNEGVGYVPPKTGAAADKTKEDRELRGRILGKRGVQIAAERQQQLQQQRKKKQTQEDSDDEDLGRSALGKRKRPRREQVQEEPDVKQDEEEEAREEEEEEKKAAEGDVAMQNTEEITTTTAPKRNKNKKKKNKNKAAA